MVDHLRRQLRHQLERIDIHRSKLGRSQALQMSELLKEIIERSPGMESPISRQTRSNVTAKISSLTTTAVGRSFRREDSVKVRCLFLML